MADIENTISSILSDPDAMRQIQELGKSLGLSNNQAEKKEENYYPVPEKKNSGFDISSIASLLSTSKESEENKSKDTLKSIAGFLPLLKGLDREDETTALLNALKPFLSEEKRHRLEAANKMLRVMRMLPLLKSQGLF